TDDGLRVTIRRSKTDQEGQGATIAIIRGGGCCPVKAVKAWLDAAGISEGPIFRPVRKGGKCANRGSRRRGYATSPKAVPASSGSTPPIMAPTACAPAF